MDSSAKATAASTATFTAAAALLEVVVNDMPPDRQIKLASAIESGARIGARLVLPIGCGVPDVAFDLMLPSGEVIELASVNVGAASSRH